MPSSFACSVNVIAMLCPSRNRARICGTRSRLESSSLQHVTTQNHRHHPTRTAYRSRTESGHREQRTGPGHPRRHQEQQRNAPGCSRRILHHAADRFAVSARVGTRPHTRAADRQTFDHPPGVVDPGDPVEVAIKHCPAPLYLQHIQCTALHVMPPV